MKIFLNIHLLFVNRTMSVENASADSTANPSVRKEEGCSILIGKFAIIICSK